MSGSNVKVRTNYHYGFECDGKSENVIAKGTEIPYKAKRYLTSYKDDQTEFEIKVSCDHFQSV